MTEFKKNKKFKIFILTIERNKKRQESIVELLLKEGFDIKDIVVFTGIDYKKFGKELYNIGSLYSKYTPLPVIACAASHILLWKHISEYKDIDYALILEDDSYIIKKKFEKYREILENKINDKNFLNLSEGVRIGTFDKSLNDKNFINSRIILGLDTYMLTPNLCKKLYSYYLINGISYHIDLHLGIIKNQIPMNYLHFQHKISKDNMRGESSMVQNHDKIFLLKFIKSSETYKNICTPIIEINNFIINTYIIFVFLFFLFLIIITFRFDKKSRTFFVYLILGLLWSILGLFIYDAL